MGRQYGPESFPGLVKANHVARNNYQELGGFPEQVHGYANQAAHFKEIKKNLKGIIMAQGNQHRSSQTNTLRSPQCLHLVQSRAHYTS